MRNIFEMIKKDRKVISPREFLRMSSEEKRNVKSTRFIPPTIGSRGFGKFEITYKEPIFDRA